MSGSLSAADAACARPARGAPRGTLLVLAFAGVLSPHAAGQPDSGNGRGTRPPETTDTSTAGLAAEIQSILDAAAGVTAYGFGVGYVDATGAAFSASAGYRTTPGLPVLASGNVTAADTFVLGSGTKPYSAAGVLRLVDRSVVALSDTVAHHIDPVLATMWDTSMLGLFGPLGARITVDHVLTMRSGIADIEGARWWEHAATNQFTEHSPLGDLQVVSNFSANPGCAGFAVGPTCTWHFPPGDQVEYCSTNYLLATLVLLAHAPQPQRDWRTFRQLDTLGPAATGAYRHTFFPTHGPLNTVGLSTVGNGYTFGRAEVWKQDAGIMGMGWGSATVAPLDLARFYNDLLAPGLGASVVSRKSLEYMQDWRLLTYGWDNGTKRYGAGLETNNPSPTVEFWRSPPLNHIATGIGHHGGTFGFEILSGYYPNINATIAVMTNQDMYHDGFLYGVSCQVVQAAARHSGWLGNLNCSTPQAITYVCAKQEYLNGTCVPASEGGGSRLEQCESSCGKAA